MFLKPLDTRKTFSPGFVPIEIIKADRSKRIGRIETYRVLEFSNIQLYIFHFATLPLPPSCFPNDQIYRESISQRSWSRQTRNSSRGFAHGSHGDHHEWRRHWPNLFVHSQNSSNGSSFRESGSVSIIIDFAQTARGSGKSLPDRYGHGLIPS